MLVRLLQQTVYFYGTKCLETILSFIQKVTQDSTISFDEIIFQSELKNGFKNFALINMIKSYNNIDNTIEDVIQTYFKQCSIMMNTQQLSKAILFLANHGINP